MSKKIRIMLLFGGRSAEHEVSVRSARSIYSALNKEKYEISLVGIAKSGTWVPLPTAFLQSQTAVIEGESETKAVQIREFSSANLDSINLSHVDVCFPVLHGPYGEDGTVQGLLKLMHVPFVGAGVLGSAVGMDKDVMKRLLRDAGIPISNFVVVKADENIDTAKISTELGLPLFVKPANLGSSVGVSKVKKEEDLQKAIDEALQFDTKVIVEASVPGRELEVSVLGNEPPEISVVGEIIPTHEFYSYEAKYLDENGAKLVIPADIPHKTSEKIRSLARKVFQVLEGADLARVDFFLRDDGEVFVNEINTMPGFTSISMYPRLWEASGIPYSELVDRLISLALKRYNREQRLKTSYS